VSDSTGGACSGPPGLTAHLGPTAAGCFPGHLCGHDPAESKPAALGSVVVATVSGKSTLMDLLMGLLALTQG
jgi:hypothetical protein